MFISCGSGAAPRGLPVFLPTTEAAAAGDPDTCVWEFTGGAGAGETGVGGPLTGADLVLTPFGAPPAAVGGYRALTGHNMGFQATAVALAALLGGTEGTIAWLIKNLARDVGYNFTQAQYIAGHVWTGGYVDMYAIPEGSAGLSYGMAPKTVVSLTNPTWLTYSFKNGTAAWMISEVGLPTMYSDVPVNNRVIVTSVKQIPTFASIDIIGRSTASAGANFDIGCLVISRKAIGLPIF